jgi:hypothetical protein
MSNNVPGTDFISLHFGTCFAQHSGKKSLKHSLLGRVSRESANS